MPTTPTDPTTAAIAWLQSEEGQKALKKWPVEIDGETLRYDRFAAGVIRWWLDDGQGEGWRRIGPAEALALYEHAWRVELEWRCDRLDITHSVAGYCVSLNTDTADEYKTRMFFAPTLAEALHKALEATTPVTPTNP
jgi:hypothetical protein